MQSALLGLSALHFKLTLGSGEAGLRTDILGDSDWRYQGALIDLRRALYDFANNTASHDGLDELWILTCIIIFVSMSVSTVALE